MASMRNRTPDIQLRYNQNRDAIADLLKLKKKAWFCIRSSNMYYWRRIMLCFVKWNRWIFLPIPSWCKAHRIYTLVWPSLNMDFECLHQQCTQGKETYHLWPKMRFCLVTKPEGFLEHFTLWAMLQIAENEESYSVTHNAQNIEEQSAWVA